MTGSWGALADLEPDLPWLKAWFEDGWDWASLRRKPFVSNYFDPSFKTYGDYWDFLWEEHDLGNVLKLPKEISWGGKKWTPFHLPLFDTAGRPATPKHPEYAGAWSAEQQQSFSECFRRLIGSGEPPVQDRAPGARFDRRIILHGLQVPPIGPLRSPTQTIYAAFDSSLFANATFKTPGEDFELYQRRDPALGAGCSFDKCCFMGRADFEGLIIQPPVSFQKVTFLDTVDFWPSEFTRPRYHPSYSSDRAVVSFRGTVFRRAWFVGSTVRAEADFSECVFHQSADFRRSEFQAPVTFSQCNFLGQADFSSFRCSNGYEVSLASTKQSAEENGHAFVMEGEVFVERADFSFAEFNGSAKFVGVTFGQGATFRGAMFPAGSAFEKCSFLDDTTFELGASSRDGRQSGGVTGSVEPRERERTEVVQDAKQQPFEMPAFDADLQVDMSAEENLKQRGTFGPMTFEGCQFWGDASFQDRTFGRQTSFADSVIYQVPDFHGAHLHQDTDVSSFKFFAAFGPSAGDLPKVDGHHQPWWHLVANFDEARKKMDQVRAVRQEAERRLNAAQREVAVVEGWFGRRRGESELRIFTDAVEIARRADSEAETRFWSIRAKLVTNHDALSTQLRKQARERLIQRMKASRTSKRAGEFERAFQTLKTQMEERRRRNEEQRFFAYEIASRLRRRTRFGTGQEVTLAEWVFGSLYKIVSNYGQSVFAPLLWLGVLGLAFGIALAVWAGNVCQETSWQTVVAFTLRQIIPVFLIRDQSDIADGSQASCIQLVHDDNPDLFGILSTVHAILNLLLWFLFALALRRRFQIS